MAFDQLEVYNNALLYCEEEKLANLTEARTPRYLLDDVWGRDPIKACLEMGFWTFATRALKMDYDVQIDTTVDFGMEYGFNKPDEYVNTVAICTDEFFRCPLNDYVDENGRWWANIPEFYVKITSNDDDYGRDYALWPNSFFEVVSIYMAKKIVGRLSQSKVTKDDLDKEMRKVLTNAIGKDLLKKPVGFPPSGSWSNARLGYWRDRRVRNDPYTGG